MEPRGATGERRAAGDVRVGSDQSGALIGRARVPTWVYVATARAPSSPWGARLRRRIRRSLA
ncbi:MAG TPA: hypothetical protein VEY67_07530, partial [Candidatus Dormibacteraeota bacterium]|nr:hypothetical protein [Candidatus Dormibacteraeota bacterium]